MLPAITNTMVFYDIALSLATIALVVSYFPLDTCASLGNCVVPIFVATCSTCAVLDGIAEGIAFCLKPTAKDEDYEESESESESDNESDGDCSESEDEEEATITFEGAPHPVTGLVMEGETLTIVCRGDVRFKIEAAATFSTSETEQEEEEEEEEEESFCVLQQE
ncbi:hypothetical protein [Medusavirus stheno T3]|uniref:Uncharacterized protein n=1 Tax=Medusavirus stheno T3 TaxID=3069717 RepID=A0A7S7YFX7_9VIRU|nr:hypothetical protein QKU73_gp350 [Acanthamoeba castellanii medusavirus]QPB44425.1 hypothetical protein [Medusavirus stheno T3]